MQDLAERATTTLAEPPPREAPGPAGLTVVVAATYTAEPIEGPLRFWLGELGFAGRVEFAPYNQVIQQLLDPTSEAGRNAGGINLVLVRPEDWARFKPGRWDEAAIGAGVAELAGALRSFAGRSGTPTIVAVPPASPAVAADPARSAFLAGLEGDLREAVADFDSLHWLGRDELGLYAVADPHDEAGDRVGHMPYTALSTAGLATAVARRVHAIKAPPFKVIALDCDNTLWKGVVGEDGPRGITLGPGMKALQEFVVAQQAAGMVVCLVSKNAEADVLEAFDLRDDFPLRRDHLVSWRVGWGTKSRALVELAEELNLGLDSFIFLDDNPVECAEVRAALPQVLTLQVPADEGMVDFLRHAWAFDRLQVTDEDRKRTAMYRQNADRTRLEGQADDIGAFVASLELVVDIARPSAEEWPRVAQLTQRTNQFNFSTVRRSEAEVRQLDRSGLECLRVTVSDRFGDYGLVGVAIFGESGDALAVDTLLLSCRVLGRGVEHALFAHLGRLARDGGLAAVEARYVPTAKNEPALNFLESIAPGRGTPAPDGPGTVYRVAAAAAAALAYRPGDDARDQLELARTGGKPKKSGGPDKPWGRDRSASHGRIIAELSRPEAVLRASEAAALTGRAVSTPFVEPVTAIQRELVALWARVLQVDRVGTADDFVALGGTSLKAARLFVEVEAQFGVRLPMTTILEAPTIARLGERIAAAARGEGRQALKLLRPGAEAGPALFLVHDGDGETLLYLNLARQLPAGLAVHGLEPPGTDRCPMLLTTIPEMAAHYVGLVRSARPEGPYLLGGMCAGGTIAFEMAVQLRASGQAVGLVALLDAADTGAERRPFLGTRRRLDSFLRSLRGGKAGAASAIETPPAPDLVPPAPAPSGSKWARLAGKARTVARKVANLAAFEARARARRVADAAAVRSLRQAVARDGQPAGDFAGPSVRVVYNHAERDFRPSTRLDAPVLLVRAGADGGDYRADDPLIAIFRDPLLGWGGRVAGGPGSIEVVDVPGGHGGMLQEANVGAIAAPLRAAIDRALGREARP